MDKLNDEPTAAETVRAEQGRQSQRDGQYFEGRVAELYRLLRYKVEHGRLFSGRQVDVFLTGKFGDLTLHRAIECKAGPVKAEHIDEFIAKLRLVRREFPAAQGTIVSGVSFTPAIASQAAQEGIQLTLYRDLAAQLFDGHSYARALIAECESNERYNISLYIEPNVGYEALGEKLKAFEMVSRWLDDPQWSQLTILGDVGTGKSFLSRMIAYRLAKRFIENPLDAPVPIFVDLRNADREFSLEGLIVTHLVKSGLPQVSFDVFQYALGQGYIVLILDGFDEMSARVSRQVTNRNFHELSRSVQGKAKVLLTCRTHYFRSRTEEEEVILGSKQDYGSETARDLYWELIARKGFRIAYLRQFEISQIEEYVGRLRPGAVREALAKIRGTYNLMELSQRPMLLEMIVKSIDKLTSSEINAATLYRVFTDAWIHRDKWRDVLSPEEKLEFLTALARSMWEDDSSSIHYSRLLEYLQQGLAAQVQDAQTLIEIDSEIRTASFLARDEHGYYGLVHKSYGEFFLARHLARRLEASDIDCLATRRLSPEIISFLGNMIERRVIEPALEAVLVSQYRPQLSENALLCLYGFRREVAINERDQQSQKGEVPLVVPLPEGAQLAGARLEQVALEGAVLRGADLRDVRWAGGILPYADLTGSDVSGAQLEKCDLAYANLQNTRLVSAVLTGANLDGADLRNCDLLDSNLSEAFLSNISWTGAFFEGAIFDGAVLPGDLRSVLETYSNGQVLASELGEITQQYWSMVVHLRPFMRKVAEWASFSTGSDPEDIVSRVMIKLAGHKDISKILQLSEENQKVFVRGVIERSSMLPHYLSHPYGWPEEYMDPEDEGGDEQQSDGEEDESEEAVRSAADTVDLEQAAVAAQLDEAIVEMLQQVEADERRVYEPTIDDETVELLAGLNSFGGLTASEMISDMRRILSSKAFGILVKYYYQGFDFEEIAQQESCSVKELRRIISKSREVIRRELGSQSGKVSTNRVNAGRHAR